MTFRIVIKLCIIFSLISPCILTSNGHRYDVETEALKLYGEDFKTVLRRFRKSPDYLKILNDKMADLNTYVKEMSLQVLHFYNNKMTQRVNDIIGITRSFRDDTTTPQQSMLYRAFEDMRRHDGHVTEETNRSIKILDGYKFFNYVLTVSERNRFRDLGFEFAGNLIHSIIKNMGPLDIPPKSTRLPFGGDDAGKNVITTTEHPHTHAVTQDSTLAETSARRSSDNTPATDTLRFRYFKPPVRDRK